MKTAKRIATAIATWAATTPAAFAAETARHDHSGILVWAFLGMCAMIVVAQVFPAALMVLGMVRGLVSPRVPAREVARK